MAADFEDAVMDGTLDEIAAATIGFLCAAQETTYANANANKLASQAYASGDFTKADDTSGRKVTRAAKTGASVVANGTAAWLVLGISATSTRVGAIPLAAGVAVTAGGTVDIGASKVNIQDPT